VGIILPAARYTVTSLLAGLGGEEELECGVLVLVSDGRPCPLCRCGMWLAEASAQLLLPRHGGQMRSGRDALAAPARWLLPIG
jgi:hypothetical protein